MLYKTRHGSNTGNTLRRRPRRYLNEERYNDGEWVVADRRGRRGQETVRVGPSDFPARTGVPYSMKKRRGWELARWVEDAMDGGALDNDTVEMVQTHRSVPLERRERAERVLRKSAGPRAPLRELSRRHGFINIDSALAMMRKEEEEEEEEEEQQKKKRKKRRRRKRQAAEEEEEEEEEASFLVGVERREQQQRSASRDLVFQFSAATIPDNSLLRKASCPWAKHYRHKRAAAALEADIEEDLEELGLTAEEEEEIEEEEEEENEEEEASHSLLEYLFSSVLVCPSAKRAREPQPTSEDRKDRKIVVEAPRDKAAPPEPALDLEDRLEMAPLNVQLPRAQLQPLFLASCFGERYREAASYPRSFAVALGGPISTPSAGALLIFTPTDTDGPVAACDVILNAPLEGKSLPLAPEETEAFFADIEAFVGKCRLFAETAFGLQIAAEPEEATVCATRTEVLLHRAVAIAGASRPEPEAPEDQGRASEPFQGWSIAGSCEICFEMITTAPSGNGCALSDCGHLFCRTCWSRHLIAAARQGRIRLLCPAADCSALADVITALRFVSLPVLQHLLRRQALDRLRVSNEVLWCPRPHCARAICLRRQESASKAPRDVTCSCGFVFCAACKGEVHWPASCVAAAAYRAKMTALGDLRRNELDTPVVKLLVKPCPGCKELIDRVSGCNYMRCSACATVFCWKCGAIWNSAQHYDCKPTSYRYQTAKFVGELFTPTSSRSNLYCAAMKQRVFRQQLGCGYLKKARLLALLAEEDGCPARVQQEARNIVRKFKEMLRVAEYAFVACMSLHRSLRTERRALKKLAEELQQLAAAIRDVINWTPLFASQPRASSLRAHFEQVKRIVKALSAHQTLLNDEKAMKSQF